MTDITKNPPTDTVNAMAKKASVPEPVVEPVEEITLKIVLSNTQADGQFTYLFNRMCDQFHKNAVTKGFWDNLNPSTDSEKIALMHSELSEVLEALRDGNPADDKVGEFTSAEVELADLLIRAMDFARFKDYRLAEAMLAKHRFNTSRPHKHGKQF